MSPACTVCVYMMRVRVRVYMFYVSELYEYEYEYESVCPVGTGWLCCRFAWGGGGQDGGACSPPRALPQVAAATPLGTSGAGMRWGPCAAAHVRPTALARGCPCIPVSSPGVAAQSCCIRVLPRRASLGGCMLACPC